MATEIDAVQVTELIGDIYDCALDPGLWPAALERLRNDLSFHNATLSVQALPGGEPLLLHVAGISAPWLARMAEYGPEVLEAWGGPSRILQYPLDEPIVRSEAAGHVPLEGNRYFEEWARPQNIFDVVAIGFARDKSTLGSVGLGRHRSAGAVTERELAVLRIVAPHFRRAVSIGRLLDFRAVEARTFRAAIDAVAAGVVLVGSTMQVLHANAVATDMLRNENLISMRHGVLRAVDDGATRALEIAVATAEADEARLGRRGIGVPLKGREGTPAVAHVLPLHRGATRAGMLPKAVAAVFIAPAADSSPTRSDALAALHDLTPAETRVMELIADGHTVAQTGQRLGIATSTAKTHLQRVFVKTGCKRQVELANLVRSFRRP